MTCSNAILTELTPGDFKARFSRGFAYLPLWNNVTSYSIDGLVYYSSQFYVALAANTNKQPDINTADWQVSLNISITDYVSDEDITAAYAAACLTINESLFTSDDLLKEAYLLISAHKLVCLLSEGGVDSSPNFAEQSKSIGSVSVSYAVPLWVIDSPIYSSYAKSQYGIDYIGIVRSLVNKVGVVGRRGSNF